MKEAARGAAASEPSRSQAPAAFAAMMLVSALTAPGCSRALGAPEPSAAAPPDGFAPIEGDAYTLASTDELVEEALRGASTEKETTLGSRMQVRSLRMPTPARGENARFNFGDGRRGWVTAMPGEHLLNTPAFSRGRLLLGGGFSSRLLYAFNAYTGELDWTVNAPDGGPSSPIVEEGKVVYNTESCEIFVADAETGKLLWHRWLGDPLMSQPAAKEGLVFSAYPVNGGHEFGAFRLGDGIPVWKTPIPADVIAAPQVHGDSVYFATMDGSALRLARADGRVVWRSAAGAASAPSVEGDRVLLSRKVAGDKGPLEQPIVLSTKEGRIAAEGERFPAPYFAGASRDRTMARTQTGAWGSVPHGEHLGLVNVAAGWAYQGSTPSVADGRAYLAVGGEIRAREIATGRELWRRSYAGAGDAQAVSPPAVIAGQLVFGTVDGHLYGVDVDTGMTMWAYDVGEPVVYQPIVAQGWIYFTTGRGRVVGLEMGDPAFDGWHMWGGNAEHAGLVPSAGKVDARTLASLERPSRGTMRLARFEEPAAAPADKSRAKVAPAKKVLDRAPPARAEAPELPLAGTRVRASVSGLVARVRVTQEFQNPHDKPIEAVYVFPLPEQAAVDAMQMRIGSRVVRARIQKRGEARETFAAARAAGKRAALLEQQRSDLFAQRVANIQPGEKIEVEIEYAQTLPFRAGNYELAFPMAVSRQHDPTRAGGTGADVDPLAPGAGATPSIAAAGPVDLEVAIEAGLPLGSVTSPTHGIAVERRTDASATVRLATGEEAPGRDFVLRYAVGGDLPQAAVLAHREGDAGFFSLVVQPPTAPADEALAPRDVTVLVDTSSSMRGKPLEQARAVAHRVLSGLRPVDTIRLLAFGEAVAAASPTRLSPTPEELARAGSFVDGLTASGASAAEPALRAALEGGPADPSRVRLVVLVSDGFIGNEADVLGAMARELGGTRIFTVGVGAFPNRFFLERAAEIGRGRAIVAPASEAPAAVAERLHALVDRPVFTDVTIDWGGLDVQDVYPRRVPDLFAGAPLVVSGRFATGGRASVRVRGSWGGKRHERLVTVELPRADASPAATPATVAHAAQRVLWARAAVQDRMSRLHLRDEPKLIAEVTELGLEHRLVTQWTSFVAVDDTPADSAAETTAAAGSQTTLTPGRALPGDPEVRIAAPADARAVTVVLPFGETVRAEWDAEAGLWVARFLIPSDAAEGNHSVRVLITMADGTQERRTIGYTVDASAPQVRIDVIGEAGPGELITLRAEQIATESDRAQAGVGSRKLDAAGAHALADARRVELRTPDGEVIDMAQIARRVWQTRWRVPAGAKGTLAVRVVAVDLAANVREQTLSIAVKP